MSEPKPKVPKRRIAALLLSFGLLVAATAALLYLTRSEPPTDLTLSGYQTKLADGEVVDATIHDRSQQITGELKDGREYLVSYPEEYGDELTLALDESGVRYEVDVEPTTFWSSFLEFFLYSLLPIVLILGALYYFVSSMQGGGSRLARFGQAKTRRGDQNKSTVTFADVAGADEAVEELTEIKEFLKDPKRFELLGAKIPRGVLLFGPPGTGKTLLARAVAGEAGVPFFTISGSDFVEMFVGVGASRVRDLFRQARASAPAIVFVDEIDAVGRHRGAGVGGGHDEREQTLNQLLVELDGFDPRDGVILMAASNRPDILDPALLRPGRFDRQILVDQPDLAGRKAILAVHAKGKQIEDPTALDMVARRTPGFTGADLANVLNEAALIAVRQGRNTIVRSDMTAATDRIVAGSERRSRVLSEDEKRAVAFHEAGHALVGHVLPGADPVHKVSIVSRGRALGWTLALPLEDRYIRRRSELLDRIAMMLGGRAAEELILDDPTTGAADDIERATRTARAMVTEYGMSDELGPRKLGHRDDEPFLGKEQVHQSDYSDALAARVDEEIDAILDAAHHTARTVLTTHRDVLERLATTLIATETVEEEQLAEIFEGLPIWQDRPDSAASAMVAPTTGKARLGVVPPAALTDQTDR